jgi:choline kinase/phosphatidylglycerophosphate synthase
MEKELEISGRKNLASKALILAAGGGMRLDHPVPKPIYKLLGIPLLARTLFTLEEAGISEAYIVLGYEAEKVKSTILEIDRFKINLHWLCNNQWEEPNGLSVLAGEGFLNEPFILCMSDHVFDPLIVEKLRTQKTISDGVILAVDYDLDRIFDLEDATKIRIEDGHIKEINKYVADFNAVDTGFFLATPQIFSALRETCREGKSLLSDGIQKLADKGLAQIMDIQGLMWQDIDTLEDVKQGGKKIIATLGKPEDGIVSRYINRPISKSISRWLVKTPLSANMVTLLNMILGIIGGALAVIGGYWLFLISALLFQVNSIIDGTDGEIAHLKFQKSKRGQWWDTIADNIVYLVLISGLTIGIKRTHIPDVFFVFGLLTFFSTLGAIISLYTHMIRKGKSGSVLSVKYGFEKWNIWLRGIILFIAKRDTWALTFLILALFGKIQYSMVFMGPVSLGVLLGSLRANLQLTRSRKKKIKCGLEARQRIKPVRSSE